MPDLNSLYGGSGGIDPAITSGLADLERRKISADTAGEARISKTLDEDSARMKAAFAAEGASAHDIKPWDEKAESAKHNYDPIEAFGSVGSVFAILASAFTHQPMENALNGAASAMNAIKQGKKEDYQRAYEAWKSNSELALKRHQMMHEEYVDAGELLKTNLAAGRAKMTAAAARFGDQKTLFLLEHGMDKELIDLQMARQNSALKMAEALPKIEEDHIKLTSLLDMKDENGQPLYDQQHPGSPRSQRAIKQWHEMWSTTQHYNSISQEEGKAVEELVSQGMPRAEAIAKVREGAKAGGAGASNLTTERQRAQDVAKYRSDLKTQGYSDTEIADKAAAYEAKLKREAGAITANRSDELAGKINRIELAEHITDKIDHLLLKHKAITGLGGIATRPLEVIANVLGSNETDRVEFAGLVSEMQTIAPRILLDSNNRPISAEAAHVYQYIKGLRPGDTGPNTLRGYFELRDQMEFIKKGYQKRRGEAPAEEAPADTGGEKWWDSPAAGRVK